MKLIVVDDDPAALLIISEMTRSLGFETLCADSGEMCLRMLQEEPVSLVLCDWEMPGMDGPMLFKKLRQEIQGRYLYLMLVTGRDDKEDLIEGLNAGADDFINKPVNPEELRVRLRSAVRVLELQETLDQRNTRLKEANERIEQTLESVTADLKLAADMQFDLLPKEQYLNGVAANWLFKPASFLAGDIFDYFLVGKKQLVFYIVDVEGHGIPSALTSFAVNNQLNPSAQGMCVRNLRNASSVEQAVLRIIEDLNRQFTTSDTCGRYFTMVFGVVDLENGKVSFTQAGHPPPLLCSARENSVSEVGGGGMPIGMFESAKFEVTTVDINVGDRLFIYSDGAVECTSDEGELYGNERLNRALERCFSVPIEKIDNVLDREFIAWNGSGRFDDDVSMVCLEFSEIPAFAKNELLRNEKLHSAPTADAMNDSDMTINLTSSNGQSGKLNGPH